MPQSTDPRRSRPSGQSSPRPVRRPPPRHAAPSGRTAGTGQRPRPSGRPAAGQRQSPPAPRRPRPQRNPQQLRTDQIHQVQQRRKRKRKRNYTLYYIILFFFLTVAGVVLSLTVFFNVRTIEVVGSSIYTAEDVLPILGAQEGDNLLRINTGKLRENVLEGLLRADQVEVKRIFPSTLRVEVTDGVPEVQMETGGKWYSLSDSGRILGILTEPEKDNGLLIVGLDLTGLAVGDYISDKTQSDPSGDEEAQAAADLFQSQYQAMESFFSALKEAQVSNVTAIDFSDVLKLTFYWQNRVKVVLGSFSELTYKLRLCRAILEDPSQLPDGSTGALNAEEASSAGVFFQEDQELELPGGGNGGVWNWNDDEEENLEENGEDSSQSDPESPSPSSPAEDGSSQTSSDGDVSS